jgi:hypothetical protein
MKNEKPTRVSKEGFGRSGKMDREASGVVV